MEETTSLEAKLSSIEQELNAYKAALLADAMSPEKYTALAAHLREEKKALKDEIAKARNPVPAQAPAGNFVILPQILPLSFIILSSSRPPPSFFRIPEYSRRRITNYILTTV